MFIEELSEKEVGAFLSSKYSGIETKIPDIHKFDKPVAFNKFNGSMVFETEYVCYIFTDFEYAEIDRYRAGRNGKGFVTKFDKDWLTYMHNRFGDRYKKAFLEYRQNNKQSALRLASQAYDDETKKIEDKMFG